MVREQEQLEALHELLAPDCTLVDRVHFTLHWSPPLLSFIEALAQDCNRPGSAVHLSTLAQHCRIAVVAGIDVELECRPVLT